MLIFASYFSVIFSLELTSSNGIKSALNYTLRFVKWTFRFETREHFDLRIIVGKTFCARRLAQAMMGERDESRICLIQFHQNYSYEDFVMGYKPVGGAFELQKGIFYLNSATLWFNFIYKFLSNKKLLRMLPCQIFHLS